MDAYSRRNYDDALRCFEPILLRTDELIHFLGRFKDDPDLVAEATRLRATIVALHERIYGRFMEKDSSAEATRMRATIVALHERVQDRFVEKGS